MRLQLACALVVCAAAHAQLFVEESATHAGLMSGVTSVSLALDNRLDRAVAVRVDLAWIDPAGKSLGQKHLQSSAPRGKSTVDAALPLDGKDDALFYRLRYSVIPDAVNLAAFPPLRGILAFTQIAEHAFILNAQGIGGSPRLGAPYEFRVFATHPVTHRPMAGVKVRLNSVDATTDANGAAILRITPDGPDDWEDSDTLTIEGQLGDLMGSVEAHRPAMRKATVLIYTDKPLFQPGQTAHLRILALGQDGRAQADTPYVLRILDDSSTLVQLSEVKTSRFGIASADWEIAGTAEAGKYRVEVRNREDDEVARRVLEVRHYELPSFRVTATSDQPFYLVGQDLAVDIRADYLFGKPVAGGKVKITELDEEKALREGTLDATGRFRTSLKSEDEPPAYARFIDHRYTAYVTDPTTNRTEQRSFDLRVSRDPVHLYVVRQEASVLGPRLYLAAYTPDGKPAVVDVQVSAGKRVVSSGRTNRFGLVRLQLPSTDDELVVATGTTRLEAGTLGTIRAPILLETDRSLYRAGQPIRCHITSVAAALSGTLLAWSEDGQVLYSHQVDVRNGAGDAGIPYDPAFPRSIFVAFLSARGVEYSAGRMVLYPGSGELRITARPSHDTYRPGERAGLSFAASTRTGAPVEAALGIAVVDQAVFERAETDQAGAHRGWFRSGSDFDTRIAGMTLADLLNLPPEKIDADYQLVAEAMLDAGLSRVMTRGFLEEQASQFARDLAADTKVLTSRLEDEYHHTLRYPTGMDSLTAIAGYNFDGARDSWDQPFRARFSTERENAVLEFLSSGPDRKFDTEDDMVAATVRRKWFLPFETTIGEALEALKDYPATADEFTRLLDDAGIRFDRLRDPWHNPLRAAVKVDSLGRHVEIQSAGPDHKFGTNDDFTVATYRGTFFREMQEKMEQALQAARAFPVDETQFRAILAAAGIDFGALRDPWGRAYAVAFKSDSQFADRNQIYIYQDYGGLAQQRKTVTPIKVTFRQIEVRSDGPDGVRNTYDDFAAAQFRRVLEEEKPTAKPAPTGQLPKAALAGRGTISGAVTDSAGSGVPDVEITLNDIYVTRSDEMGRYYFRGVPPGSYTVHFHHPAFQAMMFGQVPVRPDQLTRLDARLELGAVSQMVTVMAESVLLDTSSGTMASVQEAPATFTPRVRDYFPETLLWNPELVTDAAGKAAIDFKLADSITTWHVAVIGSTVDGRIAEADAEIRAFQPFFVDLDPPQVLTVADEVALPVPIRNYLDKDQTVSVEVAAPPALSILEKPAQPAIVGAGASLNSVVRLRAASAASDARLRVTAKGASASDAIEKPVSIHPDGEPVARSVSDIVEAGRLLRLDVPADAIAGSLRAEVKLYPTLLAHVIESLEAMLTKPTGCAEQTISSSYPNLLFLRALRDSGLHDVRPEEKARRNLRSGYQRLLSYRTSDGAFSYWPNQKADIAITAYAISFFQDLDGFLEIDSSVLDQAEAWLSKQDPSDMAVRGMALRALAKAGKQYEKSLIERLGELARAAATEEDPYAIATFALAAMDAGKPELAAGSIARLRGLAHDDQGMAYWHLQRNTPFHGWGRAGRIEATALAVTALSKWRGNHAEGDPQLGALVDRGVLFLLRNKDRDGLWMSTQATMRVFLAMLAALADGRASKPGPAQVYVNGALAETVQLPGGASLQGPVTLDVTRFLNPGMANEVSIQTPTGRLGVQARFTAAWYETWKGPRTSDELGFEVRYSTAEASPNQPVRCDVRVSRPSFRGYGMVIAEIGLPPGAEVDRGTLADARVDSYEVAPDHVTFYVWPTANDSKFSFTFRPRYVMRALTAPSVLYDYYNPEARVVLPPASLSVK